MKLTPQNARISKDKTQNQETREADKQTKANAGDTGETAGINGESAAGKQMPAQKKRRVAPEFTLILSNKVCELLRTLPDYNIRTVKAEAYARIYTAEEKLCGVPQYVTLMPMAPMVRVPEWWKPFQVEDIDALKDKWFELAYRDTYIREYELVPSDGPSPDGGPPEPKMTRQQALVEERKKKRAEKRKNGPKGGAKALGSRGRKPPKKNGGKHQFTVLYRMLRREFNHTVRQLQRALQPRLARSLDDMQLVCGNAISDAARMLVVHRQHLEARARAASELFEQRYWAFTQSIRDRYQSLTRSRKPLVQEVRHNGRLESRCVAQNTGLKIRFSSWSWDEPPPVDWSQYPFGIEIDWAANLFGAPPEDEQQAFG